MVLSTLMKGLFLIVFVLASFEFARYYKKPILPYVLTALLLSILAFLVETLIKKKKLRDLLIAFLGITMGLTIGVIVGVLFSLIPAFKPVLPLIYIASILFFTYISFVIILSKKEELFEDITPSHKQKPTSQKKHYHPKQTLLKILDTSAIIDGRILEVAKTGFLEGTLVIPKFILRELQSIADSKEHDRRLKGRHGLEIVKALKELKEPEVWFVDDDYPHIKEVDSKLIELAKRKRAKLITTDYNLQELAEIRGVYVLNINQLALSLKPPLQAGDIIKIKVVREGKERGQGVGYLIDGTMVVIDDAAHYIGKEVECTVHSIIQQDTGRIVFARLKRREK